MPTSRPVMSTTGSHQKRARRRPGPTPAEDEHLVGQRVEERARAGGAVLAGEVAVEAVAAGEDDPGGDSGPVRRPVAGHEGEQRQRRGHPGDGDGVGRRRQGRRAP